MMKKVFPHIFDEKYREESKSLGLITDDEKIRLLKAEMYRFARSGRPIDNHVKALNVLIRHEENKESRPFTWGEQLSSILNVLCGLGLMSLGSAIIFNVGCIPNNSAFCEDVKGVSANVIQYFKNEGNNGN